MNISETKNEVEHVFQSRIWVERVLCRGLAATLTLRCFNASGGFVLWL